MSCQNVLPKCPGKLALTGHFSRTWQDNQDTGNPDLGNIFGIWRIFSWTFAKHTFQHYLANTS